MPVLEIRAPYDAPPGLLETTAALVSDHFGIEPQRVMIFWQTVGPQSFYNPSWLSLGNGPFAAPVVLFNCREIYPTEKVREVISALKRHMELSLGCPPDTFIAVRRIKNGEICAFTKLWE
jgi:hypothetical protein